MVTPCISNIQHFNIELMHTTLKLKTHIVPVTCVYRALCEGILYTVTVHCVRVYCMQYTLTQCTAHTPHSSQYAAITLKRSCTSSTYALLTKCVILAKY